MPPRKRTFNQNDTSRTRRSTRQVQVKKDEDIPDVFKDMLAEAYAEHPEDFGPSPRPVKRRRVDNDEFEASDTTAVEEVEQQSDDDSDVEFEDVQLTGHRDHEHPDDHGFSVDMSAGRALHLDLATGTTTPSRQVGHRKAITKELRQLRLSVHKWHVLCLLMHLAYRNQWCEDWTVHETLKPLVSKNILKQLHTDEARPQSERNFAFNTGIEAVCAIWKQTFTVCTRGLHRARWRDDIDMAQELEDAEDPIDRDEFKRAARKGTGSRDLGAQLFCALLRSIAVETRLVSSLQVLPFTAAATGTPQKTSSASTLIHAAPQSFGTTSSRPKKKKRQKQFEDSAYPITWVEVFNPAIMQWIPLDPLVRNTINKPRTGFEPPLTDSLNSFAYVVAFEDDGSARDVTLRYTSQFNAKIRSMRVESTTGGERWWRTTMNFFKKRHREPRDDIEDAALLRKLTSEGLPKNVQDFKGHPVYMLERHLRRNEVLEPRREVGKFSSGVGKKGGVESVFRREDVKLVRSSEAWYRRGRDVIVGEQPLKRMEARRSNRQVTDDADDDIDDSVALYAEQQTQVYVPPPVSNGKVPRNAFGNLDVYVSSMIPAGAVHVRHPMAARATQILSVDAVDAVTGFVFKGRQGTAAIDGVVVAKEHTAAVVSVVERLQDAAEEEIKEQISAIVLSVWKRMYEVLRVRAKIKAEYGTKADKDDKSFDHEDADEEDAQSEVQMEDDSDDPTYTADDHGGFMPDHEAAQPLTSAHKAEETELLERLKDKKAIFLPDAFERRRVVVIPSPHQLPSEVDRQVAQDRDRDRAVDDLFGDEEGDTGGGFLIDGTEDGGFEIDENIQREPEPEYENKVDNDSDDDDLSEGGFIPDDNSEGGGFNLGRTMDSKTENADSLTPTSIHLVSSSTAPPHESARKIRHPADPSSTKAKPTTDGNPTSPSDIALYPTVTSISQARGNEDTGHDSSASSTSSPSASHETDPRKPRGGIDSPLSSAAVSIDPSQENAEEGWLDGAFESD